MRRGHVLEGLLERGLVPIGLRTHALLQILHDRERSYLEVFLCGLLLVLDLVAQEPVRGLRHIYECLAALAQEIEQLA